MTTTMTQQQTAGTKLGRGVLMAACAAVAAGLAGAGTASAGTVVLDFEDRAGMDFGQTFPADYHGVKFSDAFTTYSHEQGPYKPNSGTTRVAVNRVEDSATDVRFSFVGTDQVFGGAFFSGHDDVTVQFKLFHNGVEVGQSGSLTVSAMPAFLASGFAGAVDEVVITGDRGFYVFDDLSYATAGPAQAIPLPPAVWGGAAMLAAVGAARLRRRHLVRC